MPETSPPPDASKSARASAVARRRQRRRLVLAVLLAAWLGTAWWETHKPLPAGTRLAAPWSTVADGDVSFLADLTTADAYGRPVITQTIFDEVLRVVGAAREFVVLDYFLFNDGRAGPEGTPLPMRPLSAELRDALLARKRAVPGLRVLFVTDPINDVYGGAPSHDLAQLAASGIDVAVTDLDRLRDSNFLYSGLWRIGVRWWSGGASSGGWLPDPLETGPEQITFSVWARLCNFKANHRKVVIADDGKGGLVGIVSSANPHDASSAHSNVALRLRGAALAPLLASEMAIARFSGWNGVHGAPVSAESPAQDPPHGVRVRLLTEGAIQDALLERIGATGRGEAIDIAMFYLSDRAIIEALLAASRRGAAIRIILDPNKDAFGHAGSGLPNRPAASELVAASDGAIRVRWYRTHGEQFHSALVMIYGPSTLWLTLGSANLTRRELGDYDLEANVAVETTRDSTLSQQALQYFETLWDNRAPAGTEYTADVGAYADPSQLSYWAYRLMEASGLARF